MIDDEMICAAPHVCCRYMVERLGFSPEAALAGRFCLQVKRNN